MCRWEGQVFELLAPTDVAHALVKCWNLEMQRSKAPSSCKDIRTAARLSALGAKHSLCCLGVWSSALMTLRLMAVFVTALPLPCGLPLASLHLVHSRAVIFINVQYAETLRGVWTEVKVWWQLPDPWITVCSRTTLMGPIGTARHSAPHLSLTSPSRCGFPSSQVEKHDQAPTRCHLCYGRLKRGVGFDGAAAGRWSVNCSCSNVWRAFSHGSDGILIKSALTML